MSEKTTTVLAADSVLYHRERREATSAIDRVCVSILVHGLAKCLPLKSARKTLD
jgi:hypothetical protein